MWKEKKKALHMNAGIAALELAPSTFSINSNFRIQKIINLFLFL